MAAKIFNKFKEPKYAEFSRKDLVVDIKNGDLYYKSNLGVHKVPSEVSSNTFGNPPTSPVLKGNTFKSTGQREGDSAITGSLTLIGNITASGIISASGVIFAGLNNTPTSTSVYYNTTTGELTYGTAFTAAGISGSWQGQNFTSASQTFLTTGQRNGDSAITGSLTVTGTIIAQEFHTEFVSASILYESGSTKFGDTLDDTHQFTGSLEVTGSGIRLAGATDYGANLITIDDGIKLKTFTNSPKIILEASTSTQRRLELKASSGGSFIGFGGTSNVGLSFYDTQDSDAVRMRINSTGNVGIGTTTPTEALTVKGNISASGFIYANSASIIESAYSADGTRGTLLVNGNTGGFSPALGTSVQIQSNIDYRGRGIHLTTAEATADEWFAGVPYKGGGFQIAYDGLNGLPWYKASSSLFIDESNNVGIGTTTPTEALTVEGNISASGKLYGGLANTNQSNLLFYNDSGGELTYASTSSFLAGLISSSAQIADDISGSWQGQEFVSASQTFLSTGQRSGDSAITGSLEITSNITSSGNIRAASMTIGTGTVYPNGLNITNSGRIRIGNAEYIAKSGNDLSLFQGRLTLYNVGSGAKFTGAITASGNISASGKLYGGLQSAASSDITYYDTTTGELTYGPLTAVSPFTAAGISGSFTITSASIAVTLVDHGDSIAGNTQAISVLNSAGLISASVLDSPAQGQARLTTNGVATTVDLHLETTDKVTFAAVTSSLIASTTNLILNSDLDNNSAGAYDNIIFQTHGSERMRISGSGNVGIGTALPDKKLVVSAGVTGNGDISASGKLYGGLDTDQTSHMVYYNPIGGELTYEAAVSSFTAEGISGSWQGQNFISGAQVLENLNPNTLSSSAQIATDISGAFNGVTSSFLLNTTDTLTGDLTVTGTITAQEFHTEFVSASIIFESGSTQFGNSADDIHTFSGSINVKDEGHITASGNISASGDTHIFGGNVGIDTAPAAGIKLHVNGDVRVDSTDGVATRQIRAGYFSSGQSLQLNAGAAGNVILGDGTARLTLAADDSATFVGHITASGDISSSGTITANLLHLRGTTGHVTFDSSNSGDLTIDAADDIRLDAGGADIVFKYQGTEISRFTNDSSDFKISTSVTNKDIILAPNGSGQVNIEGNINASGQIISPKSKIGLRDLDWAGNVAGSTPAVAQGDVIYNVDSLSTVAGNIYSMATDGTLTLADADAVSTSSTLLVVALSTNANLGLLLRGLVRLKISPGASIGQPIYLSTTAGNAQSAAPSGTGDVVRVLGYQLTPNGAEDNVNVCYFNPDNTWVEVA